jgi:diguanylate cyclase (GGDEF)-like protein
MDAILGHLSRITNQRDHHHLDVAILTALEELMQAREVRIFDVFLLRKRQMLRMRLSIKDGQIVVPKNFHANHEQPGKPVANIPALKSCMDQRASSAVDVESDGGAVLWLPIWNEDGIHTCLAVITATQREPAARELLLGVLNIYGNYQRLLHYSQQDSLTGLLNRKTFDDNFSSMVNTGPVQAPAPLTLVTERRNTTSVREHWLAVLDIDHFKKVNDQFGHLYGDEVLILIANLLRTSFRAQDCVFRFGGEEFVILLRSVTLDEAKSIFERLRHNVEAHNFPQVGKVTVSLGFSSVAGSTPVVILGHADQALYYAKQHGRNQVCHYEALVDRGDLQLEQSNDSVEFFFDTQLG